MVQENNFELNLEEFVLLNSNTNNNEKQLCSKIDQGFQNVLAPFKLHLNEFSEFKDKLLT
jgi:hypothetical protein